MFSRVRLRKDSKKEPLIDKKKSDPEDDKHVVCLVLSREEGHVEAVRTQKSSPSLLQNPSEDDLVPMPIPARKTTSEIEREVSYPLKALSEDELKYPSQMILSVVSPLAPASTAKVASPQRTQASPAKSPLTSPAKSLRVASPRGEASVPSVASLSSPKSSTFSRATSNESSPVESNDHRQKTGQPGEALAVPVDQEPDSLLKEEVETKVPASSWWTCKQLMKDSSGSFLLWALVVVILLGLLKGTSMEYGYDFEISDLLRLLWPIDWKKELNVAFIGNAYLFVNDVPRVMEAISSGHIHQNSVIHTGGSLGSLLATGNGMYARWQTSAAEIGGGYQYYDGYGGDRIMYDYGACTVAQILQGYDEDIEYGNKYGAYYDDGLNPCINDEYYAAYVEKELENDPPNWDFVVLADQTKRMAIESAREDTVEALSADYATFLAETRATPVIVDTHAFSSSSTNMTGLGDIPTFTYLIHEGAQEYAKALSSALPRYQAPIIAPVGIAFLMVWEEDMDLWQDLFTGDSMHASPIGTYLVACVLYATLFRHLPDSEVSIPEDMSELFSNSRKLLGQYSFFPSRDDAMYLRNVAKRVVLNGHIPASYGPGDDRC